LQSAAAAAPPAWRRAPRTLGAAVTSALTHAPENAAYGLMALAPLGAAFGPQAMGLALLGAAVACLVGSGVGSGRLVSDAGAALALLTAALVAGLLERVPGPPDAAPWAVLVLVAAGIVGAGVLVVLFGLLRIGAVVKFTPYAVRTGLASGVGLLLLTSSLPAMLGQRFGTGWSADAPLLAAGAAVGATALAVTALATWRGTRVPPVLLGLGAATALHYAVALTPWAGTLAQTVGTPALPDAWFGGLPAVPDALALLAQPAVAALVAGFALTAAVVASLDALLAASIVDGRLRRSRDANRELIAQGLGNLASAAVGGLPASPAVPASLGLVVRQPQERHVVLAYAAALLALLLAVPQGLGALPLSAVGGVLAFLGAEMIEPALWRTPWQALRRGLGAGAGDAPAAGPDPRAAARRARSLLVDWAVTAAVAGCALAVGLAEAVLVGASLAVLLFVRSNIRNVVRRVWSGSERQSLKTRPAAAAEALRRDGGRTWLLQLEGTLFFGTADALRDRLQALAPQADTAILDLQQVREIDGTAARILCETAEDWAQAGRALVLAEWPDQDPRREVLEAVAAAGTGHAALRFEDDADVALEHAEDALLQRLGVAGAEGRPLALADTALARGLQPDELALLATEMHALQVPQGHALFRAGDAGDAIYVSLAGEIGLRVPGTRRRLASFAPGVTIGEMAVLARAPRSAEAVAETEVHLLRLPAEGFDRLMRQHPQLAARLLANIALSLSDRVRVLTGDLAGWMARSSAARR
jgi:SulP family sulfate permease